MRYMLPLAKGIGMVPHKSEWISSNFLHALNFGSWKGCLLCLPSMHASHLFIFLGMVGKPKTLFFLNKWILYNWNYHIYHAITNWMTNYLLDAEIGRKNSKFLHMSRSTSTTFHLHIRSWWHCCYMTSLSLQFHRTYGWNGITIESTLWTAGFSATLEYREHSAT